MSKARHQNASFRSKNLIFRELHRPFETAPKTTREATSTKRRRTCTPFTCDPPEEADKALQFQEMDVFAFKKRYENIVRLQSGAAAARPSCVLLGGSSPCQSRRARSPFSWAKSSQASGAAASATRRCVCTVECFAGFPSSAVLGELEQNSSPRERGIHGDVGQPTAKAEIRQHDSNPSGRPGNRDRQTVQWHSSPTSSRSADTLGSSSTLGLMRRSSGESPHAPRTKGSCMHLCVCVRVRCGAPFLRARETLTAQLAKLAAPHPPLSAQSHCRVDLKQLLCMRVYSRTCVLR